MVVSSKPSVTLTCLNKCVGQSSRAEGHPSISLHQSDKMQVAHLIESDVFWGHKLGGKILNLFCRKWCSKT